jgi:hypothetical protein
MREFPLNVQHLVEKNITLTSYVLIGLGGIEVIGSNYCFATRSDKLLFLFLPSVVECGAGIFESHCFGIYQ